MIKLLRLIINRIRGEEDPNVLVERGLIVGKNFRTNGKCIIDPSHCWLIEIGNNVILALRVHFLAHDAGMWNDTGYTKIALVKIGDNALLSLANSLLVQTRWQQYIFKGLVCKAKQIVTVKEKVL